MPYTVRLTDHLNYVRGIECPEEANAIAYNILPEFPETRVVDQASGRTTAPSRPKIGYLVMTQQGHYLAKAALKAVHSDPAVYPVTTLTSEALTFATEKQANNYVIMADDYPIPLTTVKVDSSAPSTGSRYTFRTRGLRPVQWLTLEDDQFILSGDRHRAWAFHSSDVPKALAWFKEMGLEVPYRNRTARPVGLSRVKCNGAISVIIGNLNNAKHSGHLPPELVDHIIEQIKEYHTDGGNLSY